MKTLKIASEEAMNPILVAVQLPKWNAIKKELIEMWRIVGDLKSARTFGL